MKLRVIMVTLLFSVTFTTNINSVIQTKVDVNVEVVQ